MITEKEAKITAEVALRGRLENALVSRSAALLRSAEETFPSFSCKLGNFENVRIFEKINQILIIQIRGRRLHK